MLNEITNDFELEDGKLGKDINKQSQTERVDLRKITLSDSVSSS